MKTKHIYECEICGKTSEDKAEIIKCEARGIPERSKYPAVGTMFEYGYTGYDGIFAIASVYSTTTPHILGYDVWACRVDAKSGDSLRNHFAALQFRLPETEIFRYRYQITSAHRNSAEFSRMLQFLWSQNIMPVYYDEDGWEVKYGQDKLISSPPIKDIF